ncbi:MAG TPA: hypothetical protein VLN49_09850 [Gemmatimonadaceae bacterium]|nr:hypothetical protein [Gemmatimonadaceae bacterium]
MADANEKQGKERADRPADDQLSDARFDPKHQKNNEWLRDQVGEDHNLSGSSTFHTLPDQPEEGENSGGERSSTEDRDAGTRDAQRRQSKR